jgi:hypothetical protein
MLDSFLPINRKRIVPAAPAHAPAYAPASACLLTVPACSISALRLIWWCAALAQENEDILDLVVGTPPWAAMVCFTGVLVAAGSDCGYIAVGNERSANEGNGVNCETD